MRLRTRATSLGSVHGSYHSTRCILDVIACGVLGGLRTVLFGSLWDANVPVPLHLVIS